MVLDAAINDMHKRYLNAVYLLFTTNFPNPLAIYTQKTYNVAVISKGDRCYSIGSPRLKARNSIQAHLKAADFGAFRPIMSRKI